MTTLYLTMTAKLSAHWREHGNAYPQKFVLTPTQLEEYGNCLKLSSVPGAQDLGVEKHMGVPIEVSESTPGVMVAADGSEVALQ
jgi:hypothetical protein